MNLNKYIDEFHWIILIEINKSKLNDYNHNHNYQIQMEEERLDQQINWKFFLH